MEIVEPAGTHRITATQLAEMKRSKVTISDHGVNATFQGVRVSELLALAGVVAGEKLRDPELVKGVIVEAADSYRAAFTLVELDQAFTDRLVILADTRDGKPLSEKEGPFRIIVEGEKKQGAARPAGDAHSRRCVAVARVRCCSRRGAILISESWFGVRVAPRS